MLKAGLMELADIYVVTKSDQPGAHVVARDLRAIAVAAPVGAEAWQPPVLMCSSQTGDGIQDLVAAIERHHDHLAQTGEKSTRDAAIIRSEVHSALLDRLSQAISDANEEVLDGLAAGTMTIEQAADLVIDRMHSRVPPVP
jgi:LAO/AO transport system kinase